jgi:hypothetical protein
MTDIVQRLRNVSEVIDAAADEIERLRCGVPFDLAATLEAQVAAAVAAEREACRADYDQCQAALTRIRDEAVTMENGASWAAGLAALCLGTLKRGTE